MIVGDLVAHQGERWVVVRIDAHVRMALLVNQAVRRLEVPDTLDKDEPESLQVIANPPATWPLVAFPTKRLTGPVTKIAIPNAAARERDLETWVDWVPADPVREGGTIYFNPELRLRHGEVLIATFKNGMRGRITIPRNFGTVAQRAAAAAPKYAPSEERDRFNRDIMGEEEGD